LLEQLKSNPNISGISLQALAGLLVADYSGQYQMIVVTRTCISAS